jgi:RNA polymerase sigma factor (sigma-70 family)
MPHPLSTRSYAEQRDYTLAALARRCPWLQVAEREEMVQEAYAVALEKERLGLVDLSGMHPSQVRAYITQIALYKALDEGKRAWRRRLTPLDDEGDAVDLGAPPDERLLADVERDRVRKLVAGLPVRQQAILRLRFHDERTPRQISRQLGVSERIYRRELERAKRRIRDRYGWEDLDSAA